MASSNRHWPSLFKSKPCNAHQQWQHHDINASSLLPSGFRSPYTSGCEERSPDPKPRWNPKPEQIRILEAIFNSGMVNPPRDEIRKIRTQLQEYGHVGDANVFYWFQNRKSRSKNKHRHVFHSTTRAQTQPSSYAATSSSSSSNSSSSSASNSPMEMTVMTSQAYGYGLPKKVEVHHGYGGVAYETTNGHANASTVSSTTITSHANETQGLLNRSTVFINELAFDVIASPLNLRELFGEEAILLHSSGYPVFTDELGVTLQPLQHGASYYLI